MKSRGGFMNIQYSTARATICGCQRPSVRALRHNFIWRVFYCRTCTMKEYLIFQNIISLFINFTMKCRSQNICMIVRVYYKIISRIHKPQSLGRPAAKLWHQPFSSRLRATKVIIRSSNSPCHDSRIQGCRCTSHTYGILQSNLI